MKWLLLLWLVVGAHIHPPSQNTPEWRDVGGGGCSVRSGPATQSWRAGEVAEAVAALGHRADLSEGGSVEGGTGAGILHWYQSLEGKGGGGGGWRWEEGGERASLEMYTECNHGDRLSTQSGGLLRYYGNKPPLHQSRQFFLAVHPTALAGEE